MIKWILSCFILLFSFSLFSQITDGKGSVPQTRYFAVGIIPHYLFSRSRGYYVTVPIDKRIILEYQFSQTFALNYRTYYVFPSEDKLYFKGFNNLIHLGVTEDYDRNKFCVVFGYRKMHYDKRWYQYTFGGSNDYEELKSVKKEGFTFGFEYAHTFNIEKMDLQFFGSFTRTKYHGETTVYDINPNYISNNATFPQFKKFDEERFNLAIGVKLGLKFARNKKGRNNS